MTMGSASDLFWRFSHGCELDVVNCTLQCGRNQEILNKFVLPFYSDKNTTQINKTINNFCQFYWPLRKYCGKHKCETLGFNH